MAIRIGLCAGLVLAAAATAADAVEPPALVHYQGVLRDASDHPLAGSFDMVFRFFDAAEMGNEILVDSHTASSGGAVTVSGGLFAVTLGGGAVGDGAGPGSYASLSVLFRDHADVWLELQIGGEVLAPRTRIVSSALALDTHYVKGQDLVSTAPVDLWVDALGGDDADDGLAPERAKLTIQAALDAIPALILGAVTVHIADGTYAEEVYANRFAPRGHGITLHGNTTDPGAVRLDGQGSRDVGIQLAGFADVTIEGLEVTNYRRSGLVLSGISASLTAVRSTFNGNHGMLVADSRVFADGLFVEGNTQSGFACTRGAQCFLDDVTASSNGWNGVHASGSSITFQGPASITGNAHWGIQGEKHSTVDLDLRPDIALSGNAWGSMDSVDHSTLRGYQNASAAAPVCSERYAGICRPEDF